MTSLMTTLNPEDNLIVILKIIAKKSGLFVAKKTDIGVTIAQSMALHNHMKRSTPSLHCLKQALEAFSPVVKNVLMPSSIRKHVSSMEKDGIVPSRFAEVNCSITKAGNKSGMCTFYYCARHRHLLEAMIRRMYLDNACESSKSFQR